MDSSREKGGSSRSASRGVSSTVASTSTSASPSASTNPSSSPSGSTSSSGETKEVSSGSGMDSSIAFSRVSSAISFSSSGVSGGCSVPASAASSFVSSFSAGSSSIVSDVDNSILPEASIISEPVFSSLYVSPPSMIVFTFSTYCLILSRASAFDLSSSCMIKSVSIPSSNASRSLNISSCGSCCRIMKAPRPGTITRLFNSRRLIMYFSIDIRVSSDEQFNQITGYMK